MSTVARVVTGVYSGIYPLSHAVFIDRRSGDGFSRVPGDALIRPGEAIRYSASGLDTGVWFRVFNSANVKVFEQHANKNLAGNAWIDTVAPSKPGVYLLQASAFDTLFPFGPVSPISHKAELTFTVDPKAPGAPSGPPGQFNFGDIKTIMYIGIGLVGLIAVTSAIGSLRK